LLSAVFLRLWIGFDLLFSGNALSHSSAAAIVLVLSFVIDPACADISISVIGLLKDLTDADPEDDDDKAMLTLVQAMVSPSLFSAA
jgi:hypothetical protein